MFIYYKYTTPIKKENCLWHILGNTQYHHHRSSVGTPDDYIHIHQWFDETKGWYAHIYHRMFRHHSEGIFECEEVFGMSFENSDGKTVYTRYIGEQHVREDCNNHVPTAKEWIEGILSEKKPIWMMKTMKLNIED